MIDFEYADDIHYELKYSDWLSYLQKQFGLDTDKNGNVLVVSVSSNVRRMSDDTQSIFESLYQDE